MGLVGSFKVMSAIPSPSISKLKVFMFLVLRLFR
jgi:hypothetical protein